MKLINLTHTGTRDIETGRLLLRRFVMSDANEMFREYASYGNVTNYLTWEPHGSISETKTFLMKRLSDYERRLSLYGFIRCHQNALINMNYIKSIEKTQIITVYDEPVVMSTRKKQECIKSYAAFLSKYKV